MKNKIILENYNYYLFLVDIINRPDHCLHWDLEEGKIQRIFRMDTSDLGGWHKTLKLTSKTDNLLSDLYIYDQNNDKSVVTFCQTTPGFIKSLTELSYHERKEKLSSLYWDFSLNQRDKIYKVPADVNSIFKEGGDEIRIPTNSYFVSKLKSLLKISNKPQHNGVFYHDRPILVYVEPKGEVNLHKEELSSNLNTLIKQLNLFDHSTSIFADAGVTNFLNTDSDTSIFYLAPSRLNNGSSDFKVERFFWDIINYTISYHTLKYYLKQVTKIEQKIDSFHQISSLHNQKLNEFETIKFETFHLSILELRNSFNLLRSTIKRELPTLEEIDKVITNSVEIRSTNYNENRNFAYSFANKLKQLINSTKEQLNEVNNKIDLQMEFSTSYFQTIKTFDDLNLQKKIHLLSILVFILTVIIFFFSQWNEDTILRQFIKFIMKYF